jgi:hypothetical protein
MDVLSEVYHRVNINILSNEKSIGTLEFTLSAILVSCFQSRKYFPSRKCFTSKEVLPKQFFTSVNCLLEFTALKNEEQAKLLLRNELLRLTTTLPDNSDEYMKEHVNPARLLEILA